MYVIGPWIEDHKAAITLATELMRNQLGSEAVSSQ